MVSNVRAGMGVSLLLGLTLAALLVFLTAGYAQAQPVNACEAEIAEVRVLLTDRTNPNYVDSFTSDKDRAGLIGKLDSASAKLSQGKTQDALANLTSVHDKVSVLVAQGKLDQADADVLLPEINGAVTCVEGLQAQAPAAA